MSDSRRSARSRKTVDYSAFGGDGIDDDFADPTPPAKKSKGANKENKLKRKKDEEDTCTKGKFSQSKLGRRESLDDKLFDRDLEKALRLSAEGSQEVKVTEIIRVETHINDDLTKTDKSDKPAVENNSRLTPGTDSDVQISGCLPSIAKLDDDIIELSDEEVYNPRKRRKAAAKPVKFDDGGSDNEDVWSPADGSKIDSGNDSEDGDDDDFDPDDSDSDYGSSKKKKGNKKDKSKAAPKKVATPKSKPVSKVTVTPVNKSKPAPTKKSASKSSVKSAPSTPSTPSSLTPNRLLTGGLKKAWVPPGRTGSASSPLAGISIKSPSSGLRLGLSRHQKVKPLHPTVTS